MVKVNPHQMENEDYFKQSLSLKTCLVKSLKHQHPSKCVRFTSKYSKKMILKNYRTWWWIKGFWKVYSFNLAWFKRWIESCIN